MLSIPLGTTCFGFIRSGYSNGEFHAQIEFHIAYPRHFARALALWLCLHAFYICTCAKPLMCHYGCALARPRGAHGMLFVSLALPVILCVPIIQYVLRLKMHESHISSTFTSAHPFKCYHHQHHDADDDDTSRGTTAAQCAYGLARAAGLKRKKYEPREHRRSTAAICATTRCFCVRTRAQGAFSCVLSVSLEAPVWVCG